MKSRKVLIPVSLVIVLGIVIFYYLFISMSHLPKGELITTVKCDSCGKAVNVYLVNGGATTDYSIRGEIVYNNGYHKNIYWSYHESNADVSWVSCDEININGHVLNVYKDKYDWRRKIQ